MRIKGLLKTYLTEDESKHNIHHYWKIFSVDPQVKNSLLHIILLESKNLEQNLMTGKSKVKTTTLEYIMKLIDSLVISIPDIIQQGVDILKEFNVFDELVEYMAKMTEELFKLIIIRWDCIKEVIRSMDIVNGSENELAIKLKLKTIASILKAFRFSKKSIANDIEVIKNYLKEKEADSFIEYFMSEVAYN